MELDDEHRPSTYLTEELFRRWDSLGDQKLQVSLSREDYDHFIFGTLSLLNFNIRLLSVVGEIVPEERSDLKRQIDGMFSEFKDMSKAYSQYMAAIIAKAKLDDGR